jgi:hypothetical protein
MTAGEVGLLAIDDGRWHTDSLFETPCLPSICPTSNPGGQPLGPEASQRHRIAALIRQAVGFHITFKGEEESSDE